MREVGITVGVLLLLGLGAWFALTLLDDDTLDVVDRRGDETRPVPSADAEAALTGRAANEDQEPEHEPPPVEESVDAPSVVVGGREPRPEDLLVRILDPDGRPLAEAHWQVRHADTPRRVHSSYIKNGEARIPRQLVPARADVVVRPSRALRARGLLDTQLENVDLLTLSEIRLRQGRLITGVVRDADGLEEEGVAVRAQPERSDEGRLDGHGVYTTTDRNGRYRMFVPEDVTVHVVAVSGRLDRPIVEETIEADSKGVDFVLPPEVTLRVRVEDDGGEAVARLQITMRTELRAVERPRTEERREWTDGNGLAAFHGLPPGAVVTIIANTPNKQHPFMAYRATGIRASVEEHRIRLERGLVIAGEVRTEDGQPIGGHVSAMPRPPLEGSAQTAPIRIENGRARFEIVGLAAGTYGVFAYGTRDTGWGSSRISEVEAGTTDVELSVPRLYALTARFRAGAASGLMAYWWAPEFLARKPVGRSGLNLTGLLHGEGLLYIGRAGDRRYAWLRAHAQDGDLGLIEIREGKTIDVTIAGAVLDSRKTKRGIETTQRASVVKVIGAEFEFTMPETHFGHMRTFGLPPGSYRIELWSLGQSELLDSKDGVRPGTEIVLRHSR